MNPDPAAICFGLNEEQDRTSCETFLRLLGREDTAALLCSRLSSEEINHLIDQVLRLLHTHLSKQEYHQLFLLDHEHDQRSE